MAARSGHVPGSSFPLFGSRLRSARARARLTVAACANGASIKSRPVLSKRLW
jgi:hypothetical protein